MDEKYRLPGETRLIGEIPIAITEEHQQVFPYWQTSGLENITLIHIDTHDDLSDQDIPNSRLNNDYYKKLGIGNFICPAFHYKIINDMFWISPFTKNHEKFAYIQYLDQSITKTKQIKNKIKWADTNFNPNSESFYEKEGKLGKVLTIKEFEKHFKNDNNNGRSYILDIDLDAFAKEIYGHRDIVETIKALNPGIGIEGWRKRMKETKNLLKKIPKPHLITITRSQGEKPYVPSHLVDEIQEKTINFLKRLYERRNFGSLN